MAKRGRARRAWIVHGVALGLWTGLYFWLFWDALFPATKPSLDLAGFGAVLVGMMLAGYASISTLVMVFVGRGPAVPLVVHGLMFAVWSVSVMVEQQDKRAREVEMGR